MTAQEIIRQVAKAIETLTALGIESMTNPQYKDVFFKLCVEAYREGFQRGGSPLLTADNLKLVRETRFSPHEDHARAARAGGADD